MPDFGTGATEVNAREDDASQNDVSGGNIPSGLGRGKRRPPMKKKKSAVNGTPTANGRGRGAARNQNGGRRITNPERQLTALATQAAVKQT